MTQLVSSNRSHDISLTSSVTGSVDKIKFIQNFTTEVGYKFYVISAIFDVSWLEWFANIHV